MDNFAPLDGATPRGTRGTARPGGWEPILPVPDDAPPPPQAHPTRGKPAAQWTYRDDRRRTLGYVCRFDKPGGGKDILPLTFCRRGVAREWRWKGLPAPRPLYALDQLAARPAAPVLIVEGEKAADAAAVLFPDHVAITWPNGGKAAGKADWRPLSGRDVVLWPDADAPGIDAMATVARCLTGVAAASVRLIDPPAEVEAGWDAADARAQIEAGTRSRAAVAALVVRAGSWPVTGNGGEMATDSDQKGVGSKRPRTDDLVAAIGEIELWHEPTGEAWATVHNGKGFANYALGNFRFKTWLNRQILNAGYEIPGREAKTRLLETLDVLAADGEEHEVHVRVAGALADAVYIDLGDADWRALKLSPAGWEAVDRPPVKFRRGSGMKALPTPDEGGSINDLRAWINCQSDEDWMLLLAWITSAMRPRGPYPVLALSGPPGAAKSTTARVVRSLIDPSVASLSRIPREVRDFTAAIPNSRVLAYDNIGKIPAWLSDSLCMIASGAGVRERQLHTNTGEVLIEGGRPVILNGIGDLATRSDLADRSILVNLEPPARRRAEYLDTADVQAFWPVFEAVLPGLLGGLCGIFCAAMKHYRDGVDQPAGNPRMADFAIWGNAVATAMGWQPGVFDDAYARNRSEGDEVALENSPIWEFLQTVFMAGDPEWIGSATDLKNKLLAAIESAEKSKRLASMQPSTVGGHLQRLVPVLNKAGWHIRKTRRGDIGRRWHITPPPGEPG